MAAKKQVRKQVWPALIQMMFVHIFNYRIIGYCFFGLAGIIAALDRMILDGQLTADGVREPAGDRVKAGKKASSIWIGS